METQAEKLNSKQPLVSVLMNCYNGEKYLKEAIESVLNQTYKNWELVFWDNQSKDNTAAIVKSYNDERIKYYYAPEFTELNIARHLAYKQTYGLYVAVLDADDIAHPSRLKAQVKFLNENAQVGLVASFVELIDENGTVFEKVVLPTTNEEIKERLGYSNIIFHSSAMFRKKLVDDLGGYSVDFMHSHDYNLWIKLAEHNEFGALDSFLCKYRVLNSSMSSSNKYKIISCKEAIINFQIAYKNCKSIISKIKNRFRLSKEYLKLIIYTIKYKP